MKKIFQLQEENKNSDRLVDAIKHEIRKYMKRERSKKLPKDFGYWEFDAKIGQTSDTAEAIHSGELTTALDKALADKWSECYIEIISKPAKKPVVASKVYVEKK